MKNKLAKSSAAMIVILILVGIVVLVFTGLWGIVGKALSSLSFIPGIVWGILLLVILIKFVFFNK